MDTRFSVAIHILILIAEAKIPLSSEKMAESTGTNASYIRKILSLLRKADIIKSRKGVMGYELNIDISQLSLLEIYQAVTGEDKMHLFDIHQNANDKCLVGRHIKPVLGEMFASVEDSLMASLKNRTLEDCISSIKQKL